MNIRPIQTEDDYRAAMREISQFFDSEPEPTTPEGERFEILLTLAQAYEARHLPVEVPDPVDAIRCREAPVLPRKTRTAA